MKLTEKIDLNENIVLNSNVNDNDDLNISEKWIEGEIISNVLNNDNEKKIGDPQIQPTITSKIKKLALHISRKYIESNECMDVLFKLLGYLNNTVHIKII
jgi:hypothetical protein